VHLLFYTTDALMDLLIIDARQKNSRHRDARTRGYVIQNKNYNNRINKKYYSVYVDVIIVDGARRDGKH